MKIGLPSAAAFTPRVMHTQQPRNLCPFRFTGLRFDQGECLGELLRRERINRFRPRLVGQGLVEAQPGHTQHQACGQRHRCHEFVYSDQHGFQCSFQEHGRLGRDDIPTTSGLPAAISVAAVTVELLPIL